MRGANGSFECPLLTSGDVLFLFAWDLVHRLRRVHLNRGLERSRAAGFSRLPSLVRFGNFALTNVTNSLYGPEA